VFIIRFMITGGVLILGSYILDKKNQEIKELNRRKVFLLYRKRWNRRVRRVRDLWSPHIQIVNIHWIPPIDSNLFRFFLL
jgi:hypothetical protein